MTALRKNIAIFAYLLGVVMLLATAATAGAGPSGGFGYSGSPVPATDGSRLKAEGQVIGKPIKFSGQLSGVRSGESIEVQRSDSKGNWTMIARTSAGADGKFAATWTPTKPERLQIRAVPTSASVRTASTIPTSALSVYESLNATWFGPGFYGNRTGCGKTLGRKTLGVAHKTLKCGTRVEIFFKGRSVVVPVIDRGPFRNNTTYDLTEATAKKLRFKHTGKIGALVLSGSDAPVN